MMNDIFGNSSNVFGRPFGTFAIHLFSYHGINTAAIVKLSLRDIKRQPVIHDGDS